LERFRSILATLWRGVEIIVWSGRPDGSDSGYTDSQAAQAEEDAAVEQRLRYTRDAAERIYERLVKIVEFRNAVMIAMSAVVVALVSFLVDKMCDYGLVPTAMCFVIAVVTVIGLYFGRPDDLDIDDFISDMQQDSNRTLIESIADLRANAVTARRIIRNKGRWTGVLVALIFVLSGYIVGEKLGYLRALHTSREVCVLNNDSGGVLSSPARNRK
jgi:hypothetical protein